MHKIALAASLIVGGLLIAGCIAYGLKYGLPEPITLEEGLLY